MKKIPLVVLLLSVLANIVLVIALSRRPMTSDEHINATAASRVAQARGGVPVGRAEGSATMASPPGKLAPNVWGRLASDDLKQLTANLKAAGFPREAIRAAINGVLDERYRPQLDVLYAKMYDKPFWARDSRLANPELDNELRAITNERLKITRELLGTNVPNEEGRRNRQARYGMLPDEKLDAVEAIVTDYQDLGENTGITFGAPMPWDRERRALVEAETRKDVAALLTPEELAAYDLRASHSASLLRSRMELFKPTMAEFTAILPFQQAFDAKYSEYSMSESAERTADKKQLDEQIKSALGETRYAEYQRAQDYDYRNAYNLTARLNLPVENANAVYEMKQEYQNRASAVRADRNQSQEQRTAALQALAGEAKAKLETLLTPSGARAYRQGAGWLQMMESRSGVSTQTIIRQVAP
ncbi:MAG: hypothetical protein QM715_07720 [Nibricoccus sp.]